jgi:hypothetical protein
MFDIGSAFWISPAAKEPFLHDPILELHQFALQPKQFRKINPTIESRLLGMVGDVGQAIVVDLDLEFLVEAVDHFALDALRETACIARFLTGHVGTSRDSAWQESRYTGGVLASM